MFDTEPSPEKCLKSRLSSKSHCLAWDRRARGISTLIRTLTLWAQASSSKLLVIRAGPHAEPMTKAMATHVTNIILSSSRKVVWFLQEQNTPRKFLRLADIFKSLIIQVLQHEPCLSSLQHCELNISDDPSRYTESELVGLLCLILKCLSQPIFLVVDTSVFFHMFRSDPNLVERFMSNFQSLVDCGPSPPVKILLFSYGLSEKLFLPRPDVTNRLLMTVQQPAMTPANRRKRLVNYGRDSVRDSKVALMPSFAVA